MNNDCYEFYYEMMPDTERIVYRAMYDGLINSEAIFSIPKCEYGKIGEIFEKLADDHPEIFYVKSIRIQSWCLHGGYHIIPQYRFSKDEIECMNAEINREVESLLYQCGGKSVVDTEKIIHDYLVEKATYKDIDAPYSHEMPGVFLYGIGVCEGIAKAFKYLCDNVGISSGIVVGNTKGETTAHAWNQVCIDNEWYNVDVTFDSNLTKYSDDVRYDYFNVTDCELIDRSSFYGVHPCRKYYGFYNKNQRYAKCQNDLIKMMRSRTRDVISVQIPRMNCPEEQLQKYLFKTVSDGLLGYGKYNIYIYPNYDMNVFTIKISRIGLI
jgi:hypothetical protein